MLKYKQKLAAQLEARIASAYGTSPDAQELAAMFEYPPDASMGDLAFPCFKLSRTLRAAPQKIAAALADGFESPLTEKVEAAGGYLNFTVAHSYLSDSVLPEIEAAGDKYGSTDEGQGKTVVFDYSSPNVAKPFHIGHLGTTVIGHSIKLLHEFCGYKCVGINYLGDWGTQFGKLIVAYRKWGSREKVEQIGIDELVRLYVKINNEIENDPSLAQQARDEFAKLEHRDEENLALWRWFVDISLVEYEKTYKQLGIEFDSYAGESFYWDKMQAQIQIMRDRGLLKVDDGASIIDLSEYKMPPFLVLKNDGSSLYTTRDIAAAVYRKETYHFDKSVYITAAAQSLHFAQLFKVVGLMGYGWADELVHVPYGIVSVNGAKLATRTGNVVLLKDLFAAAIERVTDIMEEKHSDLPDKEATAEAVGIGAIIFYYLYNNRIKDISFDMEDALSFEGATGPYAQYTYARTCSIIEKAGGSVPADGGCVTAVEEAELLKVLSQFGERVRSALDDYEPSVVTRYIIELATAFNRFYHECPILTSSDEVRAFRLRLTSATRTVLGTALHLICIKTPEKI